MKDILKENLLGDLISFFKQNEKNKEAQNKFLNYLTQNIESLSSEVIIQLFSENFLKKETYKNHQEKFDAFKVQLLSQYQTVKEPQKNYHQIENEIKDYPQNFKNKEFQTLGKSYLIEKKDYPDQSQDMILEDDFQQIAYRLMKKKINQSFLPMSEKDSILDKKIDEFEQENFSRIEFSETFDNQKQESIQSMNQDQQKDSYILQAQKQEFTQKVVQNQQKLEDQQILKEIEEEKFDSIGKSQNNILDELNSQFYKKENLNCLISQQLITDNEESEIEETNLKEKQKIKEDTFLIQNSSDMYIKQLFVSCFDQNCDKNNLKLKFIQQNFEQIINREFQNLNVRGFYGFQNNVQHSVEIFLDQKVEFNCQDKQKFQIFACQIKEKFVLALIFPEEILSKPFDEKSIVIELIKILQDTCSSIQICVKDNFQIKEFNTPFKKVPISGYELQINSQKPEQQLKISKLNQSHEFNSGLFKIAQNSKYLFDVDFYHENQNIDITINLNNQQKIKFDEVEYFFYMNINQLTENLGILDSMQFLIDRLEVFIRQNRLKNYLELCKCFINKARDNLQAIQNQIWQTYDEETKQRYQKIKEKYDDPDFKKNFVSMFIALIQKYELVQKQKLISVMKVDLQIGELIMNDNNSDLFKIHIKELKGVLQTLQNDFSQVQFQDMIFVNQKKGFFVLKNFDVDQITLLKFKISQNVIQLEKSTSFPKDTQIKFNNQNQSLIVFNNSNKKIYLHQVLHNLELSNCLELDIFDKQVQKQKIESISCIDYNFSNQNLFFINQNSKLFSYDLIEKKIYPLQDSAKVQPSSVIQNRTQYEEIIFSGKNNYIGLRYQNSVDIFDENFNKVQQVTFNGVLIQAKFLTDEFQECLAIQQQGQLEIFKLEKQKQLVQIKHEKIYQQQENFLGNALLDYLYLAQKKFGNTTLFKGQQKIINYLCDKKFYLQMFQYLNQLKLQDFRISHDLNEEVELQNLSEIEFTLKTWIPINFVIVDKFKLIPLKNGDDNYKKLINSTQFGKTNFKLLEKICQQIQLGVYENMDQFQFSEIKVISVLGLQTKKKYAFMNRIFGTRFNYDLKENFQGLDFTLKIKRINNKNLLYIIIDSNGLFNAQIIMEEQKRLCLLSIAISDLTIYYSENNFQENFNQFIDMASQISDNLNGEKLFQGDLLVLIQDVDEKYAQKVFMKLENQINLKIQDNSNIFDKIFEKIFYQFLVPESSNNYEIYLQKIEEKIFNQKIKSNWKNFQDFCKDLKFTTSQVFLDDDQNMDLTQLQIMVQNKFKESINNFYKGQEYFKKNQTQFKFKTSDDKEYQIFQHEVDFILDNEKKEEQDQNIENLLSYINKLKQSKDQKDDKQYKKIKQDLKDQGISLENIKKDEYEFIINQNIQYLDSKFHPLNQIKKKTLKNIYLQFEEYETCKHNEWIESFQEFCLNLIQERIENIITNFENYFANVKDIHEIINRKKLQLSKKFLLQKQDYEFCMEDCKQCKRKCVKPKRHDDECECFTDHKCDEFCFDEKCQKKNYKCDKIYGLPHMHLCKESNHFCKDKCSQKSCENQCQLKINHKIKTHNCEQTHYCKEKCSIENCKRLCNFTTSQNHSSHQCNQQFCQYKCQLCDKKCIFPDHFHQKYIAQNDKDLLTLKKDGQIYQVDFHTCGESHDCKEKCDQKGECEIHYEIVKKANQDLIKPKRAKNNCTLMIMPFQLSHGKQHKCRERLIHRCSYQCPQCYAFCQNNYNHQGPHKTSNHRMFQQKRILTQDEKQNSFKFCTSNCIEKGRSHFHFVKCKGGINCFENKFPNSVKHCDQNFGGEKKLFYDKFLCQQYWNFHNWEQPTLQYQQKILNKCNFFCENSIHQKIKNYCQLKAWHQGEHQFICSHNDIQENIQIVFLVPDEKKIQSFIAKISSFVSNVQKQVKIKGQNLDVLKFAFISYGKPFQIDQENSQICSYQIKDFINHKDLQQFLEEIELNGDSENSEYLQNGYQNLSEISWEKDSFKFLIHILDKSQYDYYNSLKGKKFKQIESHFNFINKNLIKYKLIKFKKDSNVFSNLLKQQVNDLEILNQDNQNNLDQKLCAVLIKDLILEDYNFKLSEQFNLLNY